MQGALRPAYLPTCLVAVVVSLVRSIDGDAQVVGLGLRQRRQFHADLCEMGASDLLVELLRKNVHSEVEFLRCRPERDLGEDLVRERARHHETKDVQWRICMRTSGAVHR